MSWEKVKLSEITEYITDGDHQPAPKTDSGVLFIKIKDIQNNQLVFDNALYVPQEYYERLPKNRKAVTGDTLYTVVGSYGIPAFVRNDTPFCFERNIALLHPNDRVEPQYLYYAVKNPLFYEYANNIANGSAQKLIPLSKLGNLEIDLPSIEAQRKTVDFLSAYDDLIENNQKQIKLLEEMAQRLYKEWFVDLRFPNYENTPIVDGVPQGWSIRKLETFGEIITGKTPSTTNDLYYGGEIPFVKIPDMHNTIYPIITESRLSIEGANTQKSKFIPKDSIMVSCIATVGLVNIAVQECQTNQQINSIVLDEKRDLYYVFFSSKRLKMLLDGVGSNGATMTNVNKNKFANVEIVYPTIDLRNKFYDFCKPIFEKILVLSNSVLELRNSRDRLLPKLMSGEIEV